ncbi:CP100 protein, partial [Bucco capensis]|nr:CP100 protein [Bucco capensis]
NPFTIPPDTDIFSIREKERKQAKAEHEKMKVMKIHEKITYSTKIKAKQKGLRKTLQKEDEEEARKQATDKERLKMLRESLSRRSAIKSDFPLEKETFHDYIKDRREIFLIEYIMAVKRDEIQRMENTAKNEERKVEEAEHCLEKDAAAFDEFLKQNQKNSVQALKIAKKETAAKTKKIREIQAITSQIENLQSDISRFKNTLEEYKLYRDFLYQLSPEEWQEERGKKHTKKDVLRRAFKASEGSPSPPTTAKQGANSNSKQPCSYFSNKVSFELHFSKGLIHNMFFFRSSLEDAESEICSDEDEEPELYFTDPQQVLSIFMEMEEKFLSFIQNFQENKKSVVNVINTYEIMLESSRSRVFQRSFVFWSRDEKLAELKQQADALKSSIAKEEDRVADLKLKVSLFSYGEYEADEQDKMLTRLKNKVLEAYCHCTGENETNFSTVEMLRVIEKQLSDLLDNLEKIPPAQVEQVMRAKKKERRMRLREEKLRQQKQQQEERLQRARERAQ